RMWPDSRELQSSAMRVLGTRAAANRKDDCARNGARSDNRRLPSEIWRKNTVRSDQRRLQFAGVDHAVRGRFRGLLHNLRSHLALAGSNGWEPGKWSLGG